MNFIQKPLLFPLYVIPGEIHAYAISKFINHMLRGQTLKKRLSELEGKSICINIKDVQCQFHFIIKSGLLQSTTDTRSNVTITGDTTDFWKLATQQEDPDTLFFKRNLNIEGETETGVHIKNILDSMEYDLNAHFDDVLLLPFAEIAKQLTGKIHRHIKNRYQRQSKRTNFIQQH